MTVDRALPYQPLPPEVAARRRSPLASRGGDLQAASGPAVSLVEIPFLSLVNLRVAPGSAASGSVGRALGVSLPPAGQATASCPAQGRGAVWLGPDEWLVAGPDGDGAQIMAAATTALDGVQGSVIEVSANYTTVLLSGPAARETLCKGMTIDLHPRAFGPGRSAVTTLARARVVLWQVDSAEGETGPDYLLLVRASFAAYLADWLIDAVAEFRSAL